MVVILNCISTLWWNDDFAPYPASYMLLFLTAVAIAISWSYFNLPFFVFSLAVYDLLSFCNATSWRTYWGFDIIMILRPFPGFYYRVEIEFLVFTHNDKWQRKDFKEGCWGFTLCFGCAWWRSQQWTEEGTAAQWVKFYQIRTMYQTLNYRCNFMDLIICTLGGQQVQQGAQPKGIGPWKR
jgi:hypothetical protein